VEINRIPQNNSKCYQLMKGILWYREVKAMPHKKPKYEPLQKEAKAKYKQ
jgi:hypothetical protein